MKSVVKIAFYCLSLILSGVFVSCSGSDEPDKNLPAEKERLILLYAIAANNLENNLKSDLREILDSASVYNLRNNTLLVYSVVNTGECVLQQLKKDSSGKAYFETIKEYPELPLSTDPERIREVMDYVDENFDYSNKGLILWSHSDAWLPWFLGSNPDMDKRRSFGLDNFEGGTYKTNIGELAEAIPAGMFDFIWFDCCYMANIETLYQLRDKTKTIVASVLEIYMDGMPYDITMPKLLRKNPDLTAAARAFFDYYNAPNRSIAVSISVIDTKYLQDLAYAAGDIVKNATPPSSVKDVQDYSRCTVTMNGIRTHMGFYDMKQLLESFQGVDLQMSRNLDEAFKKAVTAKWISNYDFSRKPINQTNYSGLSMSAFWSLDQTYGDFYGSLEWAEAIN